jgi:hypothetical protein
MCFRSVAGRFGDRLLQVHPQAARGLREGHRAHDQEQTQPVDRAAGQVRPQRQLQVQVPAPCRRKGPQGLKPSTTSPGGH